MKSRSYILLFPLIALVFALLVWPMVILAVESLRPQAAAPAFSLTNYREIVATPLFRRALLDSFALSAGVSIGSVVLCLAPAWLFVRRQFPGKRLLRALYTLPMSFSGVIVGFLTIIMVGRIGVIPQLLERLFGIPFLSGTAYQFSGLLIAYVYFEIPRATLTLESALRKFDFQMEAAARSLGAGRWQRLVCVILPNLRPALVSTLAVTFSASLGSFGVALILSRRFEILPVNLYQQMTGFHNAPLAAAMAVVMVSVAFIVNYGARLMSDERVHA